MTPLGERGETPRDQQNGRAAASCAAAIARASRLGKVGRIYIIIDMDSSGAAVKVESDFAPRCWRTKSVVTD